MKPKTKLKSEDFAIWVTLPKGRRAAIRAAAGSLDLPMSEFARRAIEAALARVDGGKEPFPKK